LLKYFSKNLFGNLIKYTLARYFKNKTPKPVNMKENGKLLTLSPKANEIICKQTGVSSIEELDRMPFGSFSDVPLTTSSVMKIWGIIQMVIRGNVALKRGHIFDTFELDADYKKKMAKLRMP